MHLDQDKCQGLGFAFLFLFFVRQSTNKLAKITPKFQVLLIHLLFFINLRNTTLQIYLDSIKENDQFSLCGPRVNCTDILLVRSNSVSADAKKKDNLLVLCDIHVAAVAALIKDPNK